MQKNRYNHLKYLAISCVAMAASANALLANATEVTHGEMAAAIRSANYPCAHVIGLESAGQNAWSVQCNSGKFRVSRDQDGNFTVSQTGSD